MIDATRIPRKARPQTRRKSERLTMSLALSSADETSGDVELMTLVKAYRKAGWRDRDLLRAALRALAAQDGTAVFDAAPAVDRRLLARIDAMEQAARRLEQLAARMSEGTLVSFPAHGAPVPASGPEIDTSRAAGAAFAFETDDDEQEW